MADVHPAKARVYALQAALEMRAANDTPDAVVARAQRFETYIAADYAPPAPAPAMQAKSEKASARASREK